MKKIIIASDSFKGTISSLEIISLAKKAIQDINPQISVIGLPIADGGEGTVDAFSSFLKGKICEVDSFDAFHRPIKGHYFLTEDHVAIIEIASSSKLNPHHLDVLSSSTYGSGLEINDAINRGARKIIIGLGGSATNDGGIGATVALGAKYFDQDNIEFLPLSKDLSRIHHFDLSKFNEKIKNIEFLGICDVKIPMFGPRGTTYNYALQKGADNQQKIQILEEGIIHLHDLYKTKLGIDVSSIEGSGAAGAFGSSILALYHGQLTSGIDTILDLSHFDQLIKDADYLITGEGKVDHQSFSGKVIDGILKHTDKSKCKVIIVAGVIEKDVLPILKKHPSYFSNYQTSLPNQSFDEIKKVAKESYFNKIKEVFKLL